MRRVLGLFLLVTTAAVASTAAPACGGQMPIPIPPSVSDFPPPAPAAVAYDPRIGALADVPGGLARLGSWKYEAPTIPLTPYPCAMPLSDLSTASFEVIVAPFRLMTTEVTNQAYALCVDAGTCSVPDVPLFGPNQTPLDWRDPTVARQPVLVGWGRARNFCRHYGGDLPTLGEYARATTGDDETYGQPDMLDLWQQCALGGTSAECNHLNPNRVINYFKFLDVGQDPNDIGPYGHSDLFANANEWARSFAATYLRQPPNMDWCARPYEHDIVSTDNLDGLQNVYIPLRDLQQIMPYSPGALPAIESMTPINSDADPPTAGVALPTGFRCAFVANN